MKPKSRKNKLPDINWQEALEAWNRGHESGDQSEFLKITIPFAESYATLKANKYRGGRMGMELDDHEFFSAAMQGLMEIAKKPSLLKEGEPTPVVSQFKG